MMNMIMGGGRTAVMVMVLILMSSALLLLVSGGDEQWGLEKKKAKGDQRRFVMEKWEEVVKSEGGDVRVVRGHRWGGRRTPLHIGYITMEPNTLFVPQYIDANLILFVKRGEVKIGWMYKDEIVEKQLKMGDINRIPAGAAFYMVNTGKGQRLQIICAIDTISDYSTWDRSHPPYQSFFLGGGQYPKSVLGGFDMEILTTAFNATTEEVRSITAGHTAGPIIYLTGATSSFLNPNSATASAAKKEEDHDSNPWRRTWTDLLTSVLFGSPAAETNKKTPIRSPESYNIYDRNPNFKNAHGWTVAVDRNDYDPLRESDLTVYLVNLTAGAMLAPHVNPRATEYGIVIAGSGTVEVVFPNGTRAMSAAVAEGDAFWIPRFFAFCQIASRGGPMVLFGFATSARENRPQFLVGEGSVTRAMAMAGREMAEAMGVKARVLERVVKAQREGVVLPAWPEMAPPEKR